MKRRLLRRKRIAIRVTTVEHAEVERWARLDGTTIAELARRMFETERARRAAMAQVVA